MAVVIDKHAAEVLNVSVRHSDADPVTLLPWAKEEVFSFVVYYKQRTFEGAQRRVGEWTRELIDTALKFGGGITFRTSLTRRKSSSPRPILRPMSCAP